MVIKGIRIEGFWGRATVEVKAYPDVTIFIGINGTGKTTLINLIIGALKGDINLLEQNQFNLIEIEMSSPNVNTKKKISITKKQDHAFSLYEYKIDNKTYTVHAFSKKRFIRRGVTHLGNRVEYSEVADENNDLEVLKTELKKITEVSWISVYRDLPRHYQPERNERKAAIDTRLEYLLGHFDKYQLKLENKVAERSREFQKEIVTSSLFTYEEKDVFDFAKYKKVDIQRLESTLSKAFDLLNVKGEEDKIHSYCSVLKECIKKLDVKSKGIDLQAFMTLGYAERNLKISELVEELERDRIIIKEPILNFLEILHRFMTNKFIEIDPQTNEFLIFRRIIEVKSKDAFSVYDLSSGEKQLLVQCLELLLQEQRPSVFIADEPELSLHLIWQQELIKSLRELNKNAQIIVATHSPEIVAGFSGNVINMEEIIHEPK